MPARPHPPRIIRQRAGHWRIEGDLTFATVPALLARGRCELSGAQGCQRLHLDGVRRVDSAALALLIEWWRLARREGFELEYRGLPTTLRALVELSGLDGALLSG